MKIKSVNARWIHVPIPEEQQHTSDFGRTRSFDTVLIRIETNCGLVGYGEAKEEVGSFGNYRGLCAVVNERFAPLLIDEDPRDISRLWDVMYCGSRAHYTLKKGHPLPILGRRGITVSALGGIDMALWDILGKSAGLPVWQMLGGRRQKKMEAYASGGWADARSIGKQLNSYIERGGFRAVKMRVGIQDGRAAISAERVIAARQAIGPDIKLMCDAHGTFTVPEAKLFCRLVEEANVEWFEEPTSPDDLRGYAEIRASSPIAIAAGESVFTRFDFLDLAEARCADVLQPDLAICGGITEGIRIAAIASAFNLRLAPHLWTGILAFAAGLHLSASSTCGFILEYSLGANPLLHELAEETFDVEDGLVAVPDRPGLGVSIRENWVQQYAI